MRHAYDLIVFDWDGTLMDSTAHIVRSIQRACAQLDLPVPSREAASHVIGLGLIDAMRHIHPQLSAATHQAIADAYRHQYVHQEETVELFDGVLAGLAALEDAGYLLAVATGKSRGGLNHALASTGLQTRFVTTRTVDECHSKPHPDMLLQICEQTGMQPARTLMVGDTSHDLLMARHAGTHSAGVSYGAHPLDVLQDCGPQAIFHSYPELQQWLMHGN